MLGLGLGPGPFRLLCLGAHPDDIEIGAGGTIARLATEGRLAEVAWLVLTGTGRRADEARAGAVAFTEGGPAPTVWVEGFRDGFLPSAHEAVKDRFERLKDEIRPDLVLTHRRDDLHQDHRLVNELTWNTFRDQLVLEYEIPKFDGDLGPMNVYVDLSAEGMQAKVDRLAAVFGSQAGRDWFDAETFRGLARLRGMECRAPGGYAEAFVGRKVVIDR